MTINKSTANFTMKMLENYFNLYTMLYMYIVLQFYRDRLLSKLHLEMEVETETFFLFQFLQAYDLSVL